MAYPKGLRSKENSPLPLATTLMSGSCGKPIRPEGRPTDCPRQQTPQLSRLRGGAPLLTAVEVLSPFLGGRNGKQQSKVAIWHEHELFRLKFLTSAADVEARLGENTGVPRKKIIGMAKTQKTAPPNATRLASTRSQKFPRGRPGGGRGFSGKQLFASGDRGKSPPRNLFPVGLSQFHSFFLSFRPECRLWLGRPAPCREEFCVIHGTYTSGQHLYA